jgi:dUTP pyrophosphatase|tara:strand:- start:2070 stop:2501 length:432 start_codon:yes stop_codon:yes gene_type:complete
MRYSKIREVRSPNRGTSNSAGIDFYIPTGFDQKILPGESIMIPSGIKVDIPNGTMLQVCNKSGIASKKGLLVGACIVDSDYQGEMHLNLWNVSNKAVTLASGTKLVQMILVPILLPELEEVLEGDLFVGETERGTGGFGSTGV